MDRTVIAAADYAVDLSYDEAGWISVAFGLLIWAPFFAVAIHRKRSSRRWWWLWIAVGFPVAYLAFAVAVVVLSGPF